MAYPSSSHYGSQDRYPSGGYDGHWPRFTDTTQRASPGNQLVWAVLVLGLAAYAVSYATVSQPGPTGWDIRFSTLAAIAAGLGLFPQQSAHTKLVVALAVMGFLEALPRWIDGDQNPRWAAIVIVVVTALQAVTAITALLAQLRLSSEADREPGLYDAYAYYAQAAQQYYAANAQQVQQQQPAQAHATTEAAAPAQAQQSAAERVALYEEYLNTQQARPNAAASPPRPGGRTQTAQPTAGTGISTSGPVTNNRPGIDPATGSTSQSWPR